MLALKGIYQNGQFQLEQAISYHKPVQVIITFLEDESILQQDVLAEKTSLQTAFEKLRTLCAEENYEWEIPIRHNRENVFSQ
jgi:hypothetical protein